MTVSCPICHKKCKDDLHYLKHLEEKHKNENCGCQGGGSKYLKNTLNKAKKRIEKAEKDLQMNAIKYNLKLTNQDISKLPPQIKEKMQNIALENEYLKGMIKSQEKQIRQMKTHIDKCINSIAIQYIVKK